MHSIACSDVEFECDDGKCIPIDRLCDEIKDCEGGEDEEMINCNVMNSTTFAGETEFDTEPTDVYATTEIDNIDFESTPESCKWFYLLIECVLKSKQHLASMMLRRCRLGDLKSAFCHNSRCLRFYCVFCGFTKFEKWITFNSHSTLFQISYRQIKNS